MFHEPPLINWRDYFSGAIYFFATIASTQKFLREHPPLLQPIFCQTKTQTHGEGQRGRVWQQAGDAFMFSSTITLPGPLALQQGLTQAIALALVTTLDPNNTYLRLKWPNDIYFDQRKLAGILVEGSPHPLAPDKTQLIIGIGINIRAANNGDEHHNDKAFWQEINANDSVETLSDKVMPALIACFNNWALKPYLPINHPWNDYDLYHGQQVRLENKQNEMQVLGIDQKGRLLCRDDNNTLHYLTNTRIVRS